MPNTYQICEVTVTLPPLGTTTTDGCGNKIKHGDKCRVHLYAVKPDWFQGSTFEGFTVGWFTHAGYSESPHKCSQRIMMPDGYKLVAISIDEYWLPKSWDSLPVQFVGGLISLKDVDGADRVRIGEIKGAEPFGPCKTDTVFIHDAFIDNGAVSAEYSVKMHISIEENDKAASPFEEAVRKAVQKECQPGGLIWHQRGR